MLLAVNGVVVLALTVWVTAQLLRHPSARLTDGLGAHGLSLGSYGAFFIVSITLLFLVYLFVALLIFLRRPNDGFALFTAIFLISYGAAVAYPSFVEFVQFYQSPPTWYAIPALISTLLSWTLLIPFLVLYPDGRFAPRWSSIVAVIGFLLTAAWALFPREFADSTSLLGIAGALGAVVVSGTSLYVQFWRYQHHYSLMQRQQAKWFVFALAIFLGTTFLFFALSFQSDRALASGRSIWHDLATMMTGTWSSVVIPIAVGIAILRYRLWDIDVIIRKTLVYATLTAMLALIYFATIVLLQQVFGAVIGVAQSPLAIVVSTLVIAALFTPLRRRVQDWIDRRFFRRKYDAQQVLAQFALVARDETDLDALTAELVRVVQETMQPESVSVWLRKDRN